MLPALSAPRIIERSRIQRRLQETLTNSHVLLTAPAGYGKSLTLRALAQRRPHTHFISLTPADLDLSTLTARLKPLMAPAATILLDDIHLLAEGQEVCHWLQQQLARPSGRWLLAGRHIPFTPNMLLMSGQVVHLTQDLLAFSRAEAAALLAEPEEKIAAWHERLAGWPLALSLLSRWPDAADKLPTAEAQLFHYLTHAVFAQLPTELKQFMRLTAVPLRFDEALADKLWHGKNSRDLLRKIQQNELYIQPANIPGWYRYHDLIRDYLQQGLGAEKDEIAATAVTWFAEQGEVNTAVEQALESGLTHWAASLISQIKLSQFHGDCSYLTYRRWVLALDDEALTTDLMMLVRLANVMQLMPGHEAEARIQAERAIRLAEAQANWPVAFLARANLAHWHYQEGDLNQARQIILPVLADPDCAEYPRLYALRIASLILCGLCCFPDAKPLFTQAIALADERGTRNEPFMNRANRVAHYLIPLGKLAAAEQEMAAVIDHFVDSPGWSSQYLTYWCELQVAKGDWVNLQEGVRRIQSRLEQVDSPTRHTLMWLAHYQTILTVVNGDATSVSEALAHYAGLAGSNSLHRLCVTWLACWHLRRQGEWATAVRRGRQALAEPSQFAFYRARLALEVDEAQAMGWLAGEFEDFSLQPDTRQFLRWRSRAEWVRLRGLLAVVCWHSGNERWRRHFVAGLRASKKPEFASQLTHRDPELGGLFWRIGLETDTTVPEATAALVQIGQTGPLMSLLEHGETAVRLRAIAVLGEMGDEKALPGLTAVLANEVEGTVRQELEKNILILENQTPPPLQIQLMGAFGLRRGNEKIESDRWHRPIVLRLFQYLALHAGQPLPKDRILDDLWPGTEPQKAWVTFRTVYSRLRKVLEPFMPAKSPNRYVLVRGETYTFDPGETAAIDVRHFERVVSGAISKTVELHSQDISGPLLEALQNYAPLLPALPYADWLLEPRQKLQDLYVEGCLFMAQSYLTHGRPADAVTWARKTVAAAPWLEEAYQVLMRGYARQGQRSLALHVFDEIVDNLQDELSLSPSALTKWLVDRLHNGESI